VRRICRHSGYYQEGFLQLQQAVDAAIIQILNVSAAVSSRTNAQTAYLHAMAGNQLANEVRRFADDLPASFLQVSRV